MSRSFKVLNPPTDFSNSLSVISRLSRPSLSSASFRTVLSGTKRKSAQGYRSLIISRNMVLSWTPKIYCASACPDCVKLAIVSIDIHLKMAICNSAQRKENPIACPDLFLRCASAFLGFASCKWLRRSLSLVGEYTSCITH